MQKCALLDTHFFEKEDIMSDFKDFDSESTQKLKDADEKARIWEKKEAERKAEKDRRRAAEKAAQDAADRKLFK